MTSHTFRSYKFGQDEIELWRKVIYLYTAKKGGAVVYLVEYSDLATVAQVRFPAEDLIQGAAYMSKLEFHY